MANLKTQNLFWYGSLLHREPEDVKPRVFEAASNDSHARGGTWIESALVIPLQLRWLSDVVVPFQFSTFPRRSNFFSAACCSSLLERTFEAHVGSLEGAGAQRSFPLVRN